MTESTRYVPARASARELAREAQRERPREPLRLPPGQSTAGSFGQVAQEIATQAQRNAAARSATTASGPSRAIAAAQDALMPNPVAAQRGSARALAAQMQWQARDAVADATSASTLLSAARGPGARVSPASRTEEPLTPAQARERGMPGAREDTALLQVRRDSERLSARLRNEARDAARIAAREASRGASAAPAESRQDERLRDQARAASDRASLRLGPAGRGGGGGGGIGSTAGKASNGGKDSKTGTAAASDAEYGTAASHATGGLGASRRGEQGPSTRRDLEDPGGEPGDESSAGEGNGEAHDGAGNQRNRGRASRGDDGADEGSRTTGHGAGSGDQNGGGSSHGRHQGKPGSQGKPVIGKLSGLTAPGASAGRGSRIDTDNKDNKDNKDNSDSVRSSDAASGTSGGNGDALSAQRQHGRGDTLNVDAVNAWTPTESTTPTAPTIRPVRSMQRMAMPQDIALAARLRGNAGHGAAAERPAAAVLFSEATDALGTHSSFGSLGSSERGATPQVTELTEAARLQPGWAQANLMMPMDRANTLPAAASPVQADVVLWPGAPRFGHEVGVHLLSFVHRGIHSAELTLNPTNMGPVRVRIDLRGHEARLSMSAEHADTRSALEAALPQLREQFAASGLLLSQAQVDAHVPDDTGNAFATASPGERGGNDATDPQGAQRRQTYDGAASSGSRGLAAAPKVLAAEPPAHANGSPAGPGGQTAPGVRVRLIHVIA